jgi:hypothetical protein
MIKVALLILLTTSVFNLQAKEIVLATVKSDIESDVIKIVVETDEQNELSYLYSDTYKNGSLFQRKSYSLSDIGDGFVIYQKSGRDVVILNSQDFATYAGGQITMRYLYSGLSGEYRSKSFEITQAEESWKIVDSNDRTITGFFFRAKKIWGKVVGIKAIDFKY